MAATLKLVINTAEHMGNTQANAQSQSVMALAPKRNYIKAERNDKQSYKLMMTVLGVHVLAVSMLITTQATVSQPEKISVPMMVSLVGNPAPENKLEPIEPEIAKPVQKNKSVVKKNEAVKQKLLPTAEPANVLVAEEQVEKPVAPEQAVAKNEQSESVKTAERTPVEPVATVKAEAEPVIDPPKFGAAYLNNPAPAYPPMARRLGEQGRVLLKVLVGENGNAENVQIENSSGHGKLDQAAIEAVRQWTFIPAKRSNQPISAYVLVPIKFSLNS